MFSCVKQKELGKKVLAPTFVIETGKVVVPTPKVAHSTKVDTLTANMHSWISLIEFT